MTDQADADGRPVVDSLSGEISLRAKLDHTGLTVAGKSRALAALDRLLGSLFGVPDDFLEEFRKRKKIARENQRREDAKLIELANSGELGARATQRFITDELRKQNNLESVGIEAIKALDDMPDIGTEPSDQPAEIDPDWMNIFSSYAEKASSERLRSLWGRILAGEIRKTGSFSLSTLRVISELDTGISRNFQEIVSRRFNTIGDAVLKPARLANDELYKWLSLEDVGLITGAMGALVQNLEKRSSDYGNILTKNYYLIPKSSSNTPNEIQISIVKLTRAGREIAGILPWDELDALKGIVSATRHHKIGFELGRAESRTSDTFRRAPIEVIPPDPA